MADATNKVYYCPIEVALDLLGAKWKPSVLRLLGDGAETFGELNHELPLVTRKNLDALLSELESDGLVEKSVHSDHRDRETYSLTAIGAGLGSALESLAVVGTEYAEQHQIELLDREADEPVLADEAPHWEAWSWLPL